ncbi:Rieske (2Fe-2S) protein [Actinomycetospora straminea]|uniref:Rieske domain-containing protein n=1 Tax=Actinomycetospora straminea TaxID=663607 RepID=A0ABP9E465_9PSEU|nr:Rieske 2Fe-2S domain-containing protein [Actinomycetospora straminea]MDD7931266.1 Rieske 2Fe-2S domain-containing protein [Actinomycetospora straminea]
MPVDTPVLSLAELRDRGMTAVMAGGRRVLLVAVPDGVRAYDNRCPHRAWPLERGTLADGVLTCANHRYAFDVATGRGVDPAGCDLVPIPCRVDEDGTVTVSVP